MLRKGREKLEHKTGQVNSPSACLGHS
uniref:Uncharacterized protein n=1 Tax=Rhizophora mucronata TaxID=61149 RepID=A0A2P2P5X8_RHIMU